MIRYKNKSMEERIKHFEKVTNFHDKELIKQYLEKQDKEEQQLINKISKVKCPYCRSKKIYIEYGESEYCEDYPTLCCEPCERDFEDKYGYIKVINELDCLPYGDKVMIAIDFLDQNINDVNWQEECRKLMEEYIKGE